MTTEKNWNLNVWDFNLLLSCIWLLLLQPLGQIQQIWMILRGWRGGSIMPPSPHSPAIAELLSAESSSVFRSVRLTLLQSFNMFQASQMYLHFVKNKLSCCFIFWGYFIFLLLVFCELLEPNMCFTLNTASEVCDGINGPNYSWTLKLYFNSYKISVTSAISNITFLRSLKFSQWGKKCKLWPLL